LEAGSGAGDRALRRLHDPRLRAHFPASAENHVLAVHPDHHRQGIGRALLRHAEEWLRSRGVELFHVKTLGPSDPYPPYADTRAFYQALGFRPLFETTALWGPENPALVLAKAL
jgi:GNAT superfamily N-acetyltransferase